MLSDRWNPRVWVRNWLLRPSVAELAAAEESRRRLLAAFDAAIERLGESVADLACEERPEQLPGSPAGSDGRLH